MKLRLALALCAAAFLAGCSKCSQQPQTEAPVEESMPAEGEMMPQDAAPVEGETADGLPSSDQMNEELPPGDAEGDK